MTGRQYPPRRAHTAIRLDTVQLEVIDVLTDHSGQTRSDTIRRLIDTGIRSVHQTDSADACPCFCHHVTHSAEETP